MRASETMQGTARSSDGIAIRYEMRGTAGRPLVLVGLSKDEVRRRTRDE